MRTIELEEDEYELVLLALGYATGQAMKHDRPLADTFLFAANAFNRGNPRWHMYAVPDDLKPKEIIRKFMDSLEEK